MRCLCNFSTPKLLGYSGLLPFVSITLLLLSTPYHQAFWQQALLAYGAVILTFVGALHWAFAMQTDGLAECKQRIVYVWSVVPSLAGWVSLLLPYVYGLGLLVIFFALAFYCDVLLAKSLKLPTWYLPLRRNLTLVVVFCLLTTMVFN